MIPKEILDLCRVPPDKKVRLKDYDTCGSRKSARFARPIRALMI
jgi:hypothetical protein